MPDLANNRKAFHDYHVQEKLEAGIELRGTEVKSCRNRNISLQEGYAQIKDNELFLVNVNISRYEKGNIHNHDPKRERKLLVHKKEILYLKKMTEQRGFTLVPLAFYLKQGKVKVSIGICKGKTKGDKRESLKKNEAKRDMQRAMRHQR